MKFAQAAPTASKRQGLVSDRVLAAASAILAAAALAAIMRGRADWDAVPLLIWLHLSAILAATLLAPVMLLRRKGDRRHRRLGAVWLGAMLVAAGTSLLFRSNTPGGWGLFTGDVSPIHILSIFVIIQVPRIFVKARAHDVAGHERAVRAMVVGALLVAGFFTFPFDRMLGSWLLG